MSQLVCALGPDSAGTLLHSFIHGAADRLDLAVYEVGPSYGWMLPAAVGRGVRVRLLLDGHGGANQGCLQELDNAAADGTIVPCRMVRHRAGAEGHWKLLCADAGRLAVGTGNLIQRDAPADHGHLLPPESEPQPGTREWWAFLDGAPGLVTAARSRIAVAWRRGSPAARLWPVEGSVAAPPVGIPLPCVPPLHVDLSPRRLQLAADAGGVRDMIDAALELAKRRVLVVMPYVHTWAHPVRPLLDRLADLPSASVEVRLLLGTDPSGGDAQTLRDRRIATRVMNPARCTTGHAKGMVVDDTALVMSANWSAAGLGASLESGLRIDHAAAAGYFADAFERDWETADPLGRGGG